MSLFSSTHFWFLTSLTSGDARPIHIHSYCDMLSTSVLGCHVLTPQTLIKSTCHQRPIKIRFLDMKNRWHYCRLLSKMWTGPGGRRTKCTWGRLWPWPRYYRFCFQCQMTKLQQFSWALSIAFLSRLESVSWNHWPDGLEEDLALGFVLFF